MRIPLFLLIIAWAGCSTNEPTSPTSDPNAQPAADLPLSWQTVALPSVFRPPAILPAATENESAFSTRSSTARLLTQASFGPRPEEIDAYLGKSESAWFRDQLSQSPSLIMPRFRAYEELWERTVERLEAAEGDEESDVENEDEEEEEVYPLTAEAATFSFWRNSATGPDQLRQRVAFALSQILVVSNFGGEILTDIPEPVSQFQDMLIRNAFGNYRQILGEMTYLPA
ncbi:MAG: DUF1800 family protein, partial [Myxococcota bacterium]